MFERCFAGGYEGFSLRETTSYGLVELLAVEEEGAVRGEVKSGLFGILEASAACSGGGGTRARARAGGGWDVG